MPPKPDLVFNIAPTIVETDHPALTHAKTTILATTPKPASPKPASNGKRRNRKACFVCKSVDHLIKVLTQSKPISITVVPKFRVTQPRHVKPFVTKSKSLIRRHITHSHSPNTNNSPPRVTAVMTLVGNPQHALKDKGVIDSGCSRHMTGNMPYLSNFKELNGGYVTFRGNLKGGKISGKGKLKTVTAGNQTNTSAGFQDKFDAEKVGEEIDQQYVLFLMWSSGSINPQNNDGDVAFNGKEHAFDAKIIIHFKRK
nr:ribonuclease H-like domain-containing protein [Tanacetum cinerariifolium]